MASFSVSFHGHCRKSKTAKRRLLLDGHKITAVGTPEVFTETSVLAWLQAQTLPVNVQAPEETAGAIVSPWGKDKVPGKTLAVMVAEHLGLPLGVNKASTPSPIQCS